MAEKGLKEKDDYPVVARWLEGDKLCFRTAIDKGLRHSRGDVWGVRDVGGRLSGQTVEPTP